MLQSQDILTELKILNGPRDKLCKTPNLNQPWHYLPLDATVSSITGLITVCTDGSKNKDHKGGVVFSQNALSGPLNWST